MQSLVGFFMGCKNTEETTEKREQNAVEKKKIEKHYNWQTHVVCVFCAGSCCSFPKWSKFADFMTSLSFKKSNEYIWAGGLILWLIWAANCFCSFSECEQLVSFFVSSCFHGLQAHIGLSHWNCCFSPQVGISRSPPYGVSRGIIRLLSYLWC